MRKSLFYLGMSILLIINVLSQPVTISYAKNNVSTPKKTMTQSTSKKIAHSSTLKKNKKQSSVNKKTLMELNVKVASGTSIYEYCFVLVKDEKKIEQTSWSENSTYKWDPTSAGEYIVLAAVRDKNIPTRILHKKAFHFNTPEPLKINKIKIDPQKKTVEIKATGEGSLQYYYYAVDANGDKVSLSNQYSTSNIISLKSLKKGSYTIFAKVKDAENTVTIQSISYTKK